MSDLYEAADRIVRIRRNQKRLEKMLAELRKPYGFTQELLNICGVTEEQQERAEDRVLGDLDALYRELSSTLGQV